jgi:CDP-glucose 4,6-dehydratase
MIARSYAATHGMAVAVTRMANVYGGGDLNYSRLIPATARALVRGERPIIRSDGTPERDYLYVEDAVDAYLTVADSLAKPELRGRPWNAGGDSPVAVVDVVRQMIAASGREIDPEVQASTRLGDGVDGQRLDSSAMREELGWAPTWDLDRGLRKTYAWYERTLT